MKDELMILLGCGLTALLVTNACSSMYDNDNEEDDEYDGRGSRMRRGGRRQCEGYDGCSSSSSYSSAVMPPSAPALNPASVDYYTEPKNDVVAEDSSIVPMMFSSMVTNEPYLESDYVEMKDYLANPNEIKVYNEKNGSIGLPVTDMTDISAGENNKYVYDRTIGTIGFTSTKIGGRSRGQADFIRGDLPVIPDKSGWFQVSSDPSNKLMLGAMNVANGIGQSAAPTASGGKKQFTLKTPDDMDKLRRRQDAANNPGSTAGRQFAMGGEPPKPITTADVMNAALLESRSFASSSGISASAPATTHSS